MALSFNERQVLELIFLGESPSRIEMAQTLGLTGASLTRIVSRLLAEGLIEEKADRTGQQGQPRRIISIVPGQHFSAGVTFSRRQVEVALLDLAGDIVGTERVAIKEAAPRQIVDATEAGLAMVLAQRNLTRSDLVGFGVSVPGNFGRDLNDFRAHELFPQIEGLSFADGLSAMLEAPVHFENDGACAALGEHLFGAGRGVAHLFLIHVGHGFGGGGILGGRLFRGANGNACLPGPIFPIGTSRPSGQDLLDTLACRGFSGLELTDAALEEDEIRPHVLNWIDRAGEQLGHAALIISGLFDPAQILVGGRLPGWMNQELAAKASQTVQAVPGPSRGLTTVALTAARLGPSASAVGAASLPLFANYFSGATSDTFSNYRNGRRGA